MISKLVCSNQTSPMCSGKMFLTFGHLLNFWSFCAHGSAEMSSARLNLENCGYAADVIFEPTHWTHSGVSLRPPISLPLPPSWMFQRMMLLSEAAATILSLSPWGPPTTLALSAMRSMVQLRYGEENTCCHPEDSFILHADTRGKKNT